MWLTLNIKFSTLGKAGCPAFFSTRRRGCCCLSTSTTLNPNHDRLYIRSRGLLCKSAFQTQPVGDCVSPVSRLLAGSETSRFYVIAPQRVKDTHRHFFNAAMCTIQTHNSCDLLLNSARVTHPAWGCCRWPTRPRWSVRKVSESFQPNFVHGGIVSATFAVSHIPRRRRVICSSVFPNMFYIKGEKKTSQPLLFGVFLFFVQLFILTDQI